MQSFKKFISEADKYCSDECCGSDVKAKDCKCSPDCPHCDCNAVKESVEVNEAAPKINKGKAKGSISATGLRGKGMKKFDVNVAVQNGKFEFRITDETGRFQTVGIKQAAKMLGESTVDDLVNEAKHKAESLDENTINDLTAQYINENDITLDQLENMTEEELNELIGKAIGGAFKVGAKAAVGAARLAKKGAKAASSQGRIEREKKKLAREKEKLAKAKASRSMFSKQGRQNRADDKAKLQKIKDQRKKITDKRKSVKSGQIDYAARFARGFTGEK